MSDQPQPQQPTEGSAPQPPPEGAPPEGGKKNRPKRTGWRRLIPTWRITLATCVTGLLLLGGLFFLGYSLVKIPPANALATKQSNVYLYADGSQLARDGEVNRENVPLSAISKDARNAVLAAEDREFYNQSAIDPKAMVRAAWKTATGEGKQSGSTITQQYVKNYYLAQEQTVTRKVKEFFISIKLDQEKSKDQILEGYLNTSFFGRNAYGMQAAAQAYYGIDAKDLDAAQGAYLASLLNAPSEYDVIANPQNRGAAEARWNYVLDGMVKKGWLAEPERAGLKFPVPREATLSTGMSGQRGYLVEAVKQYLTEREILTPEQLETGGYRITTTLQKPKQDAFVKAVDDQLMSELDKKDRKVDNYVRAGGASIDPKTGEVVAMYGGIDYVQQYTNGATRRDYQVGSTFKPFVFTSAVDHKASTQGGRTITPNTVYDGSSERPVEGWSGGSYAPENQDEVDYGDLSVREATDKSVNSVYAQMAVDVGPDKVVGTAESIGLPKDTPSLDAVPAVALGVATASPLDMAQAYTTLADHGRYGAYTLVKKITKEGAEEIPVPERKTSRVISREAADTTTSVLQSVVDNGSGVAAQAAGRPAAGKTGTAEQDKAAWFAGFTPELVTVVAVMGQNPETAAQEPLYGAMGLARVSGSGPPAEIWAQYTKAALKGVEVKEFDLQVQDGAEDWVYPSTPPSSGDPDPENSSDVAEPPSEEPDNGTGGTETPTGPSTGTTDGGGTADGGVTGGTADGGTTGETTGGGGTADGGVTGGETGTGGTTGETPSGGADGGGGTDAGTTTGTGGLPTTRRQ
ncbi:transglycosylase domain-containing protein [Streptomyces sp. NPDC093252]|uniref:transglycosylase domain-containing protein n=1 Tax=Streptomyces sp. NPDC093252 TaxID=3154980 RepID=UPI0034371946